MESLVTFYHNNTEVSIAIGVAIVAVLIWRPREAGKLAGAIAIIAVIGYVIVSLIDLTDSAMDKNEEAANRTDKTFQKSEQ